MLTFKLVQTDNHSIKILLRRKNLRCCSRTNYYTKSSLALLPDKQKLR